MYLLYAHARIASIVRKSGKDVGALAAGGARIVLAHEKEVALGKHLAKFPGESEGLGDRVGCSGFQQGSELLPLKGGGAGLGGSTSPSSRLSSGGQRGEG